ncbi:transposase [Candidatus Marinamargulisbacteria bacterium SCGC AG-343-D04]|nr:transposase [Candidatus Marinamargulisbacteria bacterium SCGC AG-343-D04]
MKSSFSQLERELIRERTNVGLTAARERGKVGGRPETHARDKKEIVYQMVMENPFQSVSEIASALNMSRSTIYRYIEKKR